MSIRKTMLAAALAAFAFAALPAIASAQPAVEGTEPHFTLSGGTTVLTAVDGSSSVHCTGVTGTGEFEGTSPWTTGEVKFAFTGCTSSGTKCGTASAGTGEITVGPLPFHLVTATDVTGGVADGILIAPEGVALGTTGNFTSFKCAFGLVTVQVRGTGVIGEIENFAEITKTKQNEIKIDFGVHVKENGEDTQTYETVHLPGLEDVKFDLESKVGGGEWKTAVQKGTGSIAFTNEAENTLIEE
jgi:hypothetical protein